MTFYALYLHLEDFLLPCLNKYFFGIDCPGCGIQRSLIAVFQGEFTTAFYVYPAIYTLLLLGGFVLLNLKFRFQHAPKIILVLAITNGLIISGSYIIKMNSILI
ncbi:DUF2752 domain-containing protein [Polaribacter sp. HL-MS24]|uniref:DUF2752 domain-containing protein n=1 Tax=Polaribacter sp. HL-MS24 TaxID=3077735 RepID=UPI002934B651|nr:DUF2752 domain-containing protein [Polaribacter sp. HL-MS24]WOC40246.1 DUF2752 domain-containing protein [Polaribacter sp. HL-MS24]